MKILSHTIDHITVVIKIESKTFFGNIDNRHNLREISCICTPSNDTLAVGKHPALLTVRLCGRKSTFRHALTETGKTVGICIPLAAAAHMATAYLAEYLLTFGGPMPDAAWGRYGMWSLIVCVAGGIVTIPLFAALRKRPLLCGLLSVLLLSVLLLVGAVAASILLHNPLYPL